MHPPPTRSTQLRDKARPLHKATPQSASTYSQTMRKNMNPYILPIVGIVAVAVVTMVLGLGAMYTETPLDMQVGEHRHLRVGAEQALPDE